jgi:hypothetical protein
MSGNRAIMPGVSARVLCLGLAVAGIGAALDGCGGKLVGDPSGGAGTGGSSAPGGTTGSGGGSGSGGTAFGEPACPDRVRGGGCSPTDPQVCYRTCGPEKTGVRANTCEANGVYSEAPVCSFDPSKDYSCYAIPSVANAVCPAGMAPQGSNPCDVDHCVLCNSAGGLPGGLYTDSSGATKVGWCTCQLPNASGARTWTCASDTAWPCPAGAGCGRITGGGGTTGTGGVPGGSTLGEPACLSTVAKGAACGPADQQLCYKRCGPANVGVKAETCTVGGFYAEMSGCAFDPSFDYSCYKIPLATNGACPSGASPQAGTACAVPPCTLCNSLQGVIGGQYVDAAGAPKVGWCVCQPAANGTTTWSCASDTAWPCPLGAGC